MHSIARSTTGLSPIFRICFDDHGGKVYSFLQPRDAATFECRHQSLYLFAFTPRHNQQLPNKILHPTAYSHVRLEPLSRLEYEAHGIGRKKIKIKTIFG